MIKKSTCDTLLKLANSLVDGGIIPKSDFEELKKILQPGEPARPDLELLVTQQEAAKILDCSVKTISNYVKQQRLECKKLGPRSVRITVKSLNKLIAET